jgi:hypothetical protein
MKQVKSEIISEPYLVDALSYTELKVEWMKKWLHTQLKFKITTIKVANYAEIHPLKMQIVGLNQNFVTSVWWRAVGTQNKYVFPSSANDVRLMIIPLRPWRYNGWLQYSCYCRVTNYGCFPYFVEKRQLEQLEKFNALKASKPEVVVTVGDHIWVCCWGAAV